MNVPASTPEYRELLPGTAICLEFGCDHRLDDHTGPEGECRALDFDDDLETECECERFVQ